MKKFLLALIILSGSIKGSSAQSTRVGYFNLGLYGGSLLQNMRQIFEGGVGGSLKYEYRMGSIPSLKKTPVLNTLYITLESGYESFAVKTVLQNAYVPSTYSYVPVKAGLKYYAFQGLYAEFQSGGVYYTQHGGGRAFDYSPGIGYSFKPGFEVGVRFEQWAQRPERHITGDYGQSGPFAKPGDFKQLELRLAERF